MSLSVQTMPAIVAAAGFFLTFLYLIIRISDTDGFEEFSVGISYLDTYAFILSIVPLIAGTSYLMMGFGFGSVIVNGIEIVWLRYFEWAISTPILILGVTLLSQDRALTIKMMSLDFLMIMAGFFAVMTTGGLKYSLFGISTLVFIWMLYLMMTEVTDKARNRPEPVFRLFKELRNITIALWIIYPFFWAFSIEGFNIIGTQGSFIGYIFLDIVSKLSYTLVILRRFEDING
jgi:bacteriorhodopsin